MKTKSKKYFQPPRVAEFLLKKFFPDSGKFTTVGDINEVFFNHLQHYGKSSAHFWYWKETLGSILPYIMNTIYFGGAMFKNYLKITLRNFAKYKSYTTINILGLTFGLASSIFIYLWIDYNLNVDKFNEKIDDIYWANVIAHMGGKEMSIHGTPPAVGPALEEKYPEVIKTARLLNGPMEMMTSYENKTFKERINFGDLSFFDIYSFRIISGSIPENYHYKNIIAIDDEIAGKYFGTKNPIGQTLIVNKQDEFEVVAVFASIGSNSTIKFNMIVPLEIIEKYNGRPDYTRSWYNCSYQTYVLTQTGTDYKLLSKKIDGLINENVGNANVDIDLYLFPFKDMYLEMNEHIDSVKIFAGVGILLLLIACINFINLATARSGKRAKEVGLRKVIGAERKQLVCQFYGEVALLTLVSGIIAVLIVLLLLPFFVELTGITFSIDALISFKLISIVFGIVVLTAIFSGAYPALVLSSFRPVKVLQGKLKSGAGNKLFRNILVVVQFSISIFLITAAIITSMQLKYISNKNLGYDKERVVCIPLQGNLEGKTAEIKNEVDKISGVINSTVLSKKITEVYHNGAGWKWEGKEDNVDPNVTNLVVDADFIKTFDTKIIRGNFFRKENEPTNNIVVNEQFVRESKLENPIGKIVRQDQTKEYKIIGVINDFHFRPLQDQIGSLFLFLYHDWAKPTYLYSKITPGNISETLIRIEKTIAGFNPEYPFEYSFLNEDFGKDYVELEMEIKLISAFTFLAIFISCLGLFGLAAFVVDQRIKEIGIRKVLGATVSGMVGRLSGEFLKLIIISFVIASIPGYYLIQQWLEDYPYRIEMSFYYFILAGMAAISIAFISIFYIVQKAARTNPVVTLKTE